MAEPYSNLRSKLDRAVVAYLKPILDGLSVLPAVSSATKVLPHLIVLSHQGKREVPLVGNYRFQVKIMLKFPAAIQPGNNDPESHRVAMDVWFGKAVDALMQSADDQSLKETARLITVAGRALATTGSAKEQADNADMPDFTCLAWYDAGLDGGQPEEESSAWMEVATFEAECCPSNED